MAFTVQQQQAIDFGGKKLLVSASAGSGKTTTMIERVFAMLKNGCSLDNVVMLTFTVNSAADMREKLENKLRRALAEETDPIVSARLRTELEKLDFACISTVDAFCKKIVTENFKLLNVDPRSEVIDAVETNILMRRAYQKLLDEYSNDEVFRRLYERFYGRSDENFFSLLCGDDSIYSFLCALPDIDNFVNIATRYYGEQVSEWDVFRDIYESYRRTIFSIIEREKRVNGEELSAKWTAVRAEFKRFLELFLQRLSSGEIKSVDLPTYDRMPSAKSDSEIAFRAIYDLAAKTANAFNYLCRLFDRFTDPVVRIEERRIADKYVEASVRFIGIYSELKRERDVLDFQDMERYALALLKNEAASAALKEKYKHVFVDEYQDINALQNAILSLLCGDESDMYMVGDVKQSIYGFRQSDPSYIRKMQSDFDKHIGGEHIDFPDNFRSYSDIVSFVNNVFSVIMTDERGGCDYCSSGRMKASSDVEIDDMIPAVTVAFLPKADKKAEGREDVPEVYSVKEDNLMSSGPVKGNLAEAQFVYEKICELMDRDVKYVKKDGVAIAEKFKFSDVAILFRSRCDQVTFVADYLSQKGIPVVFSDLGKYDSTPEIDELMAYLRVLDNPLDDYALTAVLLSSYGGFSDEELAMIRMAFDAKNDIEAKGKRFFHSCFFGVTAEDVGEEIYSKIVDFRKKCERDAYLLESDSLYDAVIRFTRSVDLYGRALYADPDGVRFNLLNNFIEQYCSEKFATVKEFLTYFDRDTDDGKFSAADPQVGERVTLTTVHKSKGLEYDAVFLINAHSVSNHKRQNVYADAELGIGLLSPDENDKLQPNLWSYLISEKQKIRENSELLRTMYVALTRAKRHLFISGVRNTTEDSDDRNDYMDLLCSALAHTPADGKKTYEPVNLTERDESTLPELKTVIKTDNSAWLDEYERYAAYRYPNMTDVRQKYSVTELSAELNGETVVDFINEENGADDDVLSGEMSSPEIGIAYHKAMELIDFSCRTLSDVTAFLNESVRTGEMSQRQRELISDKTVYNCISLDIIRSAVGKMQYREQPFYLMLDDADAEFCHGGALVQGVIDLCYRTERGMVLVDYKCSERSDDHLVAAYANQLRLYKKAVEEITGKEVINCSLLILNKGKALTLQL